MSSESELITPYEAATMGRMSAGTLANMRHKRIGCKFYKRGSKVLYDRKEFEAWLRAQPILTSDSMTNVSGGDDDAA